MKMRYTAVLLILIFGAAMVVSGGFLQKKMLSPKHIKHNVVVTYISSMSNDNRIDQQSIAEATVEEEQPQSVEVKEEPIKEEDNIVFDGLTLSQLTEKLDRSLNSTLSGKGYLFASRSVELGIDPYLAVAIVLHETGCKWQCSQLVQQCNNVGGQMGSPNCGGGSYQAFATIDDGINGFLDNLYTNYYAIGLNTPELINTKYAASNTWASKIYSYMDEIKMK